MLLLGDNVIINRPSYIEGLIEAKKISVKLFIIYTIWYDLGLYHGVG